MFRPAGVLGNDAKYGPVHKYSISEMLAYRDTWLEPLPDLDFDDKMLQRQKELEANAPATLVTSENGYKITKVEEMAEEERLVRQVQSVLNKLAEENFEVLVQPLLQKCLFGDGVVQEVVRRIFEKALDEPQYSELYAKMCYELAAYEMQYLSNTSNLVRASIINRAQALFESQELKINDQMAEEEMLKVRKRKIANIQFIGDLFLGGLLAKKVLGHILQATIQKPPQPIEIDIEVAIKLLDKVGSKIEADYPEAFTKVAQMAATEGIYSNRIIFAMMNLVDLQKRNFVRPEVKSSKSRNTDEKEGGGDKPAKGLPRVQSTSLISQRPPMAPSYDADQEKFVLDTLLSASEGTSWDAAVKKISIVLDNQTVPVNRMCALAFLAAHSARSTKADVHQGVSRILRQPTWDPAELRGAYSWTLTDAVMCGATEDCPKFFDRVAQSVMHELVKDVNTFGLVVSEVYGAAATQLDQVYASEGGDPAWDEEFVKSWESFCKVGAVALKAQTPGEKSFASALQGGGKKEEIKILVPPFKTVLEILAGVKTCDFVLRVLPDVIGGLASHGLCSFDDLTAWHEKNKKSQRLANAADAIAMLLAL